MPIRSHVDLCTFVRFIYIEHQDLNAKALNNLSNARDTQSFLEALSEIWSAEGCRNFPTITHESYHYWQGVRLPYLFRYATHSYRALVQTFSLLSNQLPDIKDWSVEIPELHRITTPFLCHVHDDNSISIKLSAGIIGLSGRVKKTFVISELDLLEGAASLVEWNAHIAQTHQLARLALDPKLFGRWTKRRPAFLVPFEIVSTVLADEQLALRCTLPIISGAFFTTRPVVAFCEILCRFASGLINKRSDFLALVAEAEPCRWSDLVNRILEEEMEFECAPDSDWEINGKYQRLTFESYAHASYPSGRPLHPILSDTVRAWADAENRIPGLRHFMGQPVWAGKEIINAVKNFHPPLTVARVRLPNNETRVCVVKTEEPSAFFHSSESFNEASQIILTLSSVVKRASRVFYHPDHRLCWHQSCDYYKDNFCNSYPIIPSNHVNCGFPKQVTMIREKYFNQ